MIYWRQALPIIRVTESDFSAQYFGRIIVQHCNVFIIYLVLHPMQKKVDVI